MEKEQESLRQISDAFLKSRNGAILRCAGIMVDSGRKDIARQILSTTKIDRARLAEIMRQNLYTM